MLGINLVKSNVDAAFVVASVAVFNVKFLKAPGSPLPGNSFTATALASAVGNVPPAFCAAGL